MDIRTENLTILFVDIAGFTATTSRQSRAENAHLLQTFESTLLPLIKRFKGNVVKSIGDALLLTFRSPTDAMLCSMALQDAMHAHNLRVPDDQKIHIRVAANLGEVRVTKKDIFGEPVNVAARIEGVAPADEIYLSEAVYMAMNKAEVPAQEVGFKELAGIPQPVRVYCIPRFATHRLIPQNQLPPEQGNELLFPYGGMHQRAPAHGSSSRLGNTRQATQLGLLFLLLVGLGAAGWLGYGMLSDGEETAASTAAASDQPGDDAAQNTEQKAGAAVVTESVASPPSQKAAEPVIEAVSKPAAEPIAAPVQTLATPVVEKKPEPVAPVVAKKTESVKRSEPTTVTETRAAPAPVEKTKPVEWNITSAKEAYRAGKLTKVEYKQIAVNLETAYDNRIRELKLAYRAQQLSKAEYEEQVRIAKRAYSGR